MWLETEAETSPHKINKEEENNMKKILALLAALLVMPMAFAGITQEIGITPDITIEEFEPLVWMCGSRIVYDDNTAPGRLGTDELYERINNYAFEGEQIEWTVLVMDKNGVEKIKDVYGTVGPVQGAGEKEVNCDRISKTGMDRTCNARIDEEYVTWNADFMEYYRCTLTVETPESMYNEHWVTIEVEDINGDIGTMAENEYWFLNPVVALSIDGDMSFDDVRPGTDSYSSTLLVGNDADDGSGVMMDMFITGTDFYDSSHSGAMCGTSNQLELKNFRYYAVNGAYSTKDDIRSGPEGYVGIQYGIGFNNPELFYDSAEIIQAQHQDPYYAANILAPGSEMALTFKLSLPEPCNGDFNTGSIYFWGEAV